MALTLTMTRLPTSVFLPFCRTCVEATAAETSVGIAHTSTRMLASVTRFSKRTTTLSTTKSARLSQYRAGRNHGTAVKVESTHPSTRVKVVSTHPSTRVQITSGTVAEFYLALNEIS